jgi:peptidoglycan hydrolase-like protein with peptidoglycan-binding domain
MSTPANALGATLQRGMEGPAVDALQDQMIKYGYLSAEEKASGPGRFGPKTEQVVKQFQRDNSLDANGTFDGPAQAAINQLNEGVRRESRGGVVLPMQKRLVKAGKLTQQQLNSGPGIFGPLTEAALKAFQQDLGLPPDGILTDATYRQLYRIQTEEPVGNNILVNTILPNGGVGFSVFRREAGGATQFGTERAINQLVSLATAWNQIHPEVNIQYGHISREGGIPFFSTVNPGKLAHATHTDGRTVDIRPIRKDNDMSGTDINSSSYDRVRTREFVVLLREKHPAVRIRFNDHNLIADGLVRFLVKHDDHLHVVLPA